jgi:DNA integrity scanning protein DisA with diadenylate cyclase activity
MEMKSINETDKSLELNAIISDYCMEKREIRAIEIIPKPENYIFGLSFVCVFIGAIFYFYDFYALTCLFLTMAITSIFTVSGYLLRRIRDKGKEYYGRDRDYHIKYMDYYDEKDFQIKNTDLMGVIFHTILSTAFVGMSIYFAIICMSFLFNFVLDVNGVAPDTVYIAVVWFNIIGIFIYFIFGIKEYKKTKKRIKELKESKEKIIEKRKVINETFNELIKDFEGDEIKKLLTLRKDLMEHDENRYHFIRNVLDQKLNKKLSEKGYKSLETYLVEHVVKEKVELVNE